MSFHHFPFTAPTGFCKGVHIQACQQVLLNHEPAECAERYMANFVFDDVVFVSGLRIIPLIALLTSTLYFPFF